MKLEGKGFEALVNVDDEGIEGRPIMKGDLDYIKENAPRIVTQLIVTNLEIRTSELEDVQKVDKGYKIFTVK
ncbi:PTS glucose transporter subunit IIA [Staphylococcus felis]|uniref:PTS glucose transporter subunit IIA n=1 Tax=Staphylococcus felis TaxID=46127 RepID=UPI001EE901F7|nr:PTS glucose transporter subunit IIA [Staphylococcus felis]